MCRIAGFWLKNKNVKHNAKQILANMNDSLAHGGPDADGLFFIDNPTVGLAHRRLSILDLSATGAQPMHLGAFSVVFNGEIYNFLSIKNELLALGHCFEGGSDTEVLLHAYQQWGFAAFARFRGMFAFALWDNLTQKLILVRDRLGVKPLFVYYKDNNLLFGSELKCFLQYPDFNKEINVKAVGLFLQYGYVPMSHSIYQYVKKVEAGTILVFDANNNEPQTVKYWDLWGCYLAPLVIPTRYEELEELVEAELADSFKLRMVADVPVGAFLSGGVDSSLVVGLLSQKLGYNLKTFTVGFEDKNHNEAHFAAAVAKHLNTEHTEFYCTEKDFENIIPLLPHLYDEPFGDSSAVATFLVSRLAKTEVKVSLSADGADELFGGYTKYEATLNYFPKLKSKPIWAKKIAHWLLSNAPMGWLERNKRFIPILKNYNNINYKIPKLLNGFDAKDELDFFNKSSVYLNNSSLNKLISNKSDGINGFSSNVNVAPMEGRLISLLSCMDIQSYLEGDILTKVDRATMHNAMEGREPFLDHKLVELALAIPDKFKIEEKNTKLLLRNILYKYVPKSLIDRPKQGFAVPIELWLRNLLLDDLKAIQADNHFCEAMGLDFKGVNDFINGFIKKNAAVNPSVVWYLRCLWDWYRVWIK